MSISVPWWVTPEGTQPDLDQAEHNYVPQSTLQYSTFIKRALVEALQDSFALHPTTMVRGAKVDVGFTHNRWAVPGVIIQFYERDIRNPGISHTEWFAAPNDPDPDNPSHFLKYYQRLYKGTIGFDVWAKSTTELDILRDALFEVLMMQDTTDAGYAFLNRMYLYLQATPYGTWHFPVLNLDLLVPAGESQQMAPWMTEDVLHYKVSYSVPIIGQVYSITPQVYSGIGYVDEIDLDLKIVDSQNHVLEEDFYSFTGWPENDRAI